MTTRRGHDSELPAERGGEAEGIATGTLGLIGLFVIAAQLLPLASPHYGWFIDEFYYYACTDRLDWGYVDHPPLSIFVLWFVRSVFGDSMLAARFVSASCGAATVWIGGVMAQRLGAGRSGQALAAVAIACTPLLVAIFGFYSMNAIEVVIWSACSLLLIEILQSGDEKRWWLVGLLIGLGLLNKHTMLGFACALAIGVMLTPRRRSVAERGLWVGVGVAFSIALPNLLWQLEHDWVSLEFYRNAGSKNVAISPLAALGNQVLALNPGALPIWVAGAGAMLFDRRLRPLGILFGVIFLALVFFGQSRQDRIAGVAPLAMAAGAAFWERRASRTVRVLLFAAPALVAALLAPIFLPILPPAQLARYSAALGVVPELEAHRKALALPQWFADRVGWDGYVDAIEDVYRGLSASEKDGAIIVTKNYGGAGSLEKLGSELPPVYSLHNSYYSWGPPGSLEVAIVVQFGERELGEYFETVEKVGEFQCEYCRQWRDPTPIFLVRGPKRPIADLWSELKSYL